MPRIQTGLNTLAQTRPFLEQHLLRWVSGSSNIAILGGSRVMALLWDESNRRIIGATIRSLQGTEHLCADLVIDATECSTRLAHWLAEHAHSSVPQTTVGIDLGYATGVFRAPAHLHPKHPMLYIVGPAPHQTRVGVRVLVEGGMIYGGMGGYNGDYPPEDLTGFLEFARSLSQPHIFDILSQCEPLAPIARYRIPSASRRYYSTMAGFPDGLVPIGDAICSFDPVFGQGMTVAALAAEALSVSLSIHSTSGPALRRDYLNRVDSIIDVPWDQSSSENFKYPATTGERPLLFPLMKRVKDLFTTCGDPFVVRHVYQVVTLSSPLRVLLHPRVIGRALGFRIGVRRRDSRV